MSEARKTPQSHFTGPVVIDPLTRIEGHLRIEVEVKDGRVSEARSVGTLYRGLETILVGRDPRDVQHFTQRTCGVCTYTHALASTRALEDAIKVEIPKNATYIRNLVLGMQYLHDHIVHFYHLHALDFVDVTSALQADPVKAAKICSSVSPRPASADGFKAVQAKLKAFVESGQLGPFTNAYFLGGHPAYYLDPEANLIATAHYLEALRLQVKAARAMAVFGAKNPHTQFLVAGGVTCYESLTPERIAEFEGLYKEVNDFVNQVYIPDLLLVGGGDHRIDAVASAKLDRGAFGLRGGDGVMQELFEPRLLQVDEGRHRMAAFGQEVEFVKQPVIVKDLAKVPLHALVQHGGSRPQTVADFKRALGKAQRPAAQPRAFMVIQQHDRHTPPAKIKRRGQTDRPAPDHNSLVTNRCGGILIRRSGIGVEAERQCIAFRNQVLHLILPDPGFSPAAPPTSPDRGQRSRCGDGGCRAPRHRHARR